MNAKDIEIRAQYAYREKRSAFEDLQRVRVIERAPRGTKVHVEWISPTRGLKEWIDPSHLVCLWSESEAFVNEEKCRLRMRDHNRGLRYAIDSPEDDAVTYVLSLLGEKDQHYYRGILQGPPDVIARMYARADWDPKPRSEVAYLDRKGIWNIPYDEALAFVQRFAKTEPELVITAVEGDELMARGKEGSSKSSMDEYSYQERPKWQIIRGWVGGESAEMMGKRKLTALRRIGADAVHALETAGLHDEAGKIRRRLEKVDRGDL